MKEPIITIDAIGGNCPVQADGKIDGKPFYFRARGGRWSISIGGSDVISRPQWYFSAPYRDPAPTPHAIAGKLHFAAGWMPKEAAASFIYTAAQLYFRTKRKWWQFK